MNSRERILAALRREPVDYVPCCAAFNPLSAVQRQGHEWNFPWPAGTSVEERLAYQTGELGLDQVMQVHVDLCRPAPGVESKVWLDGDVLHKAYTTPAGELHASIRYNELWPEGQDISFHSDFNIGHCVEPWLETEADLACLKQVQRLDDSGEALGSARESVAAAQRLAAQFELATVAYVGRGLTGAMSLFGASQLCLLAAEQPELVDAYLEHEHSLTMRTIEVLGELGVDIIRRNGFYETADFYGPATLERFLGPRLRREAEAARAAGMLSSYTVHTGLMPILDYLASLPMDSFFGIDIAFKDTDPAVLRDKLAPAKSFWVGPSSTFHLWQGPEATRRAVRQVFDVFGRTGLVLAPCVSAHSIMPWESTLAMIDEWRKLR